MAINKNHEFEELNGVKCSIVEKNVTPERANFLRDLLGFNGFTVVIVPTPAKPVAAPKPPPATEGAVEQPPAEVLPAPPETFTVGVTHVSFNAINAIFGRLLKTPDGHIVTLAYWKQEEKISHDEVPYFDND